MKLVMGVARPYREGHLRQRRAEPAARARLGRVRPGHGARELAPASASTSTSTAARAVFNVTSAGLRERPRAGGSLTRFIRDATALSGRVVMGDFTSGTPARSRASSSASSRRRCAGCAARLRHRSAVQARSDVRDVELEGGEFHAHVSRLSHGWLGHLPIVAILGVRHPARTPRPYVAGEALPPSE